jgi:O-antigen/teichoic acid export membrane protein
MFKKIASTFVVKILTSAVNLVLVILLSQYLGATGKGESSLLVTGVTMIVLFCNMLGGASLVFLVPRFNTFQLVLISNLWSLMICIVSWFVLHLTDILPAYLVSHVIFLSLINSLLATNLSVLLGKENIYGNNIVILLQSIINLLVFVALLGIADSPDVYLYIKSLYAAMLLAFLISSAMIFTNLDIKSDTAYSTITMKMIRYGFVNQAGHITKFVSVRLSFFLLNYFNNKAGLGVFSNGISLTESVLLITNSIATVQYATIANTADKEQSQKLTVRLCRISTILCIVAMLPIVVIPSSFYVWLFGPEFAGVQTIVCLLAPGIIFYNMALIIGHYFSGTGTYGISTSGNIAGLAVTFVMSIALFSNYTLANASIITSASYLTTMLLLLYIFKKESSTPFSQFIPSVSDIRWAREYFFSLLKSKDSIK